MVRASLLFVVIASTAACVSGRAGTRDPDGGLIRYDAGRRDGGRDAGGSTDASTDAGDRDGGSLLRETVCDDGVDQDGDGRIDCEDAECAAFVCNTMGQRCVDGACGGCRDEPSETMCGDGADEDCDGATDCADPDCEGDVCGPGSVVCGGGACPCASGFTERVCGDSMDDDCDGLSDCADPDCMGLVCGANGMVCLTDGTCACAGAVEFCNDGDDDCSGEIDDGCPRGLSACCPAVGASFGSAESGTVFSDPCPTSTMLIGVAGRESAGRVDQLQPICAALVLETDRDARPEFSFSVRRSSDIAGAIHGGGGGTPFEDRCPNNEVVIGVHGAGDASGVTHVALQCGAVSIGVNAARTWRLDLTPTGRTPDRGGPAGTLGGDCAAGGVVTELNGREGATLLRLGSTCRRLELQTI